MSKIIYQPKGKAKEYSPWAANFYNGCSNKCDYCYNRHCQAKELLGKDEPTLKKSLVDPDTARHIFIDEIRKYREKILADGKGLFFNFVSDPMLPETRELNVSCMLYCLYKDIPCVVLTKCADWYDYFIDHAFGFSMLDKAKDYIKFGFTLTGCDELEHGASTNADRIELMKKLHEEGYSTWASIEPIIDCDKSLDMVRMAAPYCNEFKIGVLSGKKNYTPAQVRKLMIDIQTLYFKYGFSFVVKNSVTEFTYKDIEVKPFIFKCENAHQLVCAQAREDL